MPPPPPPYQILRIPHDSDPRTLATHTALYRSFRLLSLRLAPSAFASTYAREAAFPPAHWTSRLTHPHAHTFLAIASTDAALTEETTPVLSVGTILGPLRLGPHEASPRGNPWEMLDSSPPTTPVETFASSAPPASSTTTEASSSRPAVHYRLLGIFTLPNARRQGISRALIRESIALARSEAELKGRDVLVSVVAEAENTAARRLYESCGFKAVERVGKEVGDASGVGAVDMLIWAGRQGDGNVDSHKIPR